MEAQETYAAFCGKIDQEGVSRILHALSHLINDGMTDIHLLFQSSGGTVGSGLCLYNFFKALPANLTIYNVGAVRSIAVLAFLGAARRRAQEHATFLIHPSSVGLRAASAHMLQALAHSTMLDDRGTAAILRLHLLLTADEWSTAERSELLLSAMRSVEVGLVHEVTDFVPPHGSRIHAI